MLERRHYIVEVCPVKGAHWLIHAIFRGDSSGRGVEHLAGGRWLYEGWVAQFSSRLNAFDAVCHSVGLVSVIEFAVEVLRRSISGMLREIGIFVIALGGPSEGGLVFGSRAPYREIGLSSGSII